MSKISLSYTTDSKSKCLWHCWLVWVYFSVQKLPQFLRWTLYCFYMSLLYDAIRAFELLFARKNTNIGLPINRSIFTDMQVAVWDTPICGLRAIPLHHFSVLYCEISLYSGERWEGHISNAL